LDDEDAWADILTSDDAQALLSSADQDEAEKVATQVKEQISLASAVQKEIFRKVATLTGGKKNKFTGSKVPFPALDARMQIPLLLARMPAQSTLELDQFNGRWKAAWKTPVTNEWKRLSRSWGFKGHARALQDIFCWVWTLAVGYGLTCPYTGLLDEQSEAAAPSGSAGSAPPAIPEAAAAGPPVKKRRGWTGG
jgi:hypothetical protein